MKTRLFKFTALLLGLWIAYSVINPEGTSSIRYNTLKSFESNSDNYNSKIFPQILCEGCRYCDEDLKENIQNLESSLEKVRLLRPITFNYKQQVQPIPSAVLDTIVSVEGITVEEARQRMELPSPEKPKTEIGFLAQEVQEVFPEVVYSDPNGNLYIDYISLIPCLVKSIQEQQLVINKLEVEIQTISAEINQFKNK